jgi:hypothetical protein
VRVPSLLYGLYEDVLARSRDVVRHLAEGEAWSDELVGNLIDTHEKPGLLVLAGPSPLLARASAFHCYLLHFQIREALGQRRLRTDLNAAIFAASLHVAWGVLGLLAPANVMWMHESARRRPMVDASARFWTILIGEGDRYTVGLPRGESLWSVQNNLRYVLVNLGFDPSELLRPLPASGLAHFIDALDRRAAYTKPR